MKKILLLFVATLLVTSQASAQVKIGGDPSTPVTSGALLELGDATSTSGGLLLPRVVLSAENANPFGAGESTTLPDGLMVYNLGGNGNLDAGLYVLQDGLWKQAGSGGGVPIVNVSLTPNTPFKLVAGDSKQFEFTTYPPNATYPSMTWNSSDTDVATVSNLGVVTGVAPGTTDISLTLGSITSDPVAVTVVTCGQPFTAPMSGMVYNTAAYSNANLTNLCWTTSNLQEAGESAKCYSNNCTTYPTRGFYYTVGAAADNACAALNTGGGTTWRVPTGTEWAALQTAFPSLQPGIGTTGTTTTLQADWNGTAALAGYYNTSGSTWYYWGANGNWWAQGTTGLSYYVSSGATTMHSSTLTYYWFSVRCVRSL